MSENPTQVEGSVNSDEDRHPSFVQALRRILQESSVPDEKVERLEVNVLASGEITYRYWYPRAEEPEGGYLEPA